MWQAIEPYEGMQELIEDDDYLPALQNIRSVITVIHYLNDRRVHPHLIRSANEVRTELGIADHEGSRRLIMTLKARIGGINGFENDSGILGCGAETGSITG